MNSPEPPWDLYRSFLAVLREGSASGAARALGLTQPTIARHVEQLEAAIGDELFIRSPRGLLPTETATNLRPYAETLEATAAALLRAASGHGTAIRGRVRISASEVVGVEVLPPILAALRARHPALVIELSLSNAVDDLLRREADIAIRMVEPEQGALLARRIGNIPIGLHAHRDYLARAGSPASLEALTGHSLIGFDRETPEIRAMARRLALPAGLHFALRADSDVAQLAAIRAGFGIGFCQAPLARRDPALVRLLPEALTFDLPTWVVMHEDLKASPRCRAVFDALVQGLGDYLR
ncbi:LysR family transcriptional regulator [Acetobacteraceae bacterium H6797]|nr:LysR family transcriptional regulator [Acetobacteraceae bacterium H6797]